MKKLFQLSALALIPASTNLYANHPSTDTVNKATSSLIDSYVADTSSAVPGFDELDDGMTKTSLTVNSFSLFGKLAANGDLQEYIELLDGVVDATISFNDDGSVTMTVYQAR